MNEEWKLPYIEEYVRKAVEIMSRLVGKDGIVVKVSEPDLPYSEVEMEYLAERLRKYIPISVIPEISPKGFLEEVAGGIREFVRRFCKRLKGDTLKAYMYEEKYGIYSCHHPVTGSFFMVLDDVQDLRYGSSEVRLYTTESYAEAEGEYKKLLEEMEGGVEWLGEY